MEKVGFGYFAIKIMDVLKIIKIQNAFKLFIIVLFITTGLESVRADDDFPIFDCVRPNVDFWTKVYSEHTSSQGILHDRDNANIIYEVVQFKTYDRRTRKRLVKNAKQKYRLILKRLANNSPVTAEEKLVLNLFDRRDRNRLLEAAFNIRLQKGQKDMFKKGLIRSGAYMAEIRRILDDYDLPLDLAYLPHVESSFNFRAYSKSGAAGVWQFTYSTGKKFLKINRALDERLDPIRATHAAAKLLKINYEILGDWPLALTAYNHGAAGMLRAKKRKGNYENIFREYKNYRFKFASRNFYSEFLAAKKVAKNYARYFGEIEFRPTLKTKDLVMPGYAPADQITARFKLSLRNLKILNPALKKSVFRGTAYVPKGYELHLPHKSKVKKLLAALPPRFFKSTPLKSSVYRVRRGDAVSLIARRNGVKVKDLLLANNLSRRSIIYPGQKLFIPGTGKFIRPRSRFFKSTPLKSLVYRVRKGDSLHRIAERNGVKVKDLLLANNLSRRSVIYPGQKILISGVREITSLKKKYPKSKRSEAALAVPKTFKNSPTEIVLPNDFGIFDKQIVSSVPDVLSLSAANKANQNLTVNKTFEKRGATYGVIKVAAAETLGHYADWLKIETSRIRRLNNLSFGKKLKLNDKLIIPLNRVNKVKFESLRNEYRRQMEDDFLNGYQIVKFRLYRMERGDNIWKLCRNDFDLPVWLIKKYNPGLNFNKLKPTQAIRVPVLKKRA